jgi:hypothetical protein
MSKLGAANVVDLVKTALAAQLDQPPEPTTE